MTGSDVEDVMQETYVKFLSVISGVDEKKNPLAFLYEIAKNKALDITRKRSRTDTDVIVEEMQIGVNGVYSHDSPLMELCKKTTDGKRIFSARKSSYSRVQTKGSRGDARRTDFDGQPPLQNTR